MFKVLSIKTAFAVLMSILFTAACTPQEELSSEKLLVEAQLQSKPHETQKISLSGTWDFNIDPYGDGVTEGWWQEDYNSEHWDHMAVPGVWDAVDKYHDYTGDAWYRTNFDYSDGVEGNIAKLVFDSVYHDSEVWLNGERLGDNNLGFIAFGFDVTSLLKSDNTLVVKANNRVKRGAVWNWGGIRRPVYLEITPETFIENVHVLSEPDLDAGSAELNVTTRFLPAQEMEGLNLRISIIFDGEVLHREDGIEISSSDTGEIQNVKTQINLSKSAVNLWHFNDPNLYTIKVDILSDTKVIHTYSDRFGIRKFQVQGDSFLLNGEPVRLVGFNMVPEDRFDGNALPLSRIKEDVDLLKSLGANFARLSGPTLPKEYLDYLDEVGFLLVEEVALWGKDRLVDPDHPTPKKWLERMVEDHYNHPSIVAWSVGNEIGDFDKNPLANEYVEGAIAHAKELDPSRLGVYISYSADFQENDPAQFSEIIMFNKYNDHEERMKVVRGYHPDKPIFFSEIGTKLDSEDPNLSVTDPEEIMGDLRKYPYLIGASFFAFNDYRSNWTDSNPTWTTPDSENRSWGVLTSYRTPKRSFYKIQKFFAPVEDLIVNSKGEDLKIKLVPRGKNTFPAYIMKGYRLVWQAFGSGQEFVAAGNWELPVITPGDTHLQYDALLPKSISSARISLLDPSGYEVLSKRLDLTKPSAPEIKSIHSSIDTIRVVFNESIHATEHQLRLTDENGETVVSQPTINDFVEVADLKPHKPYNLELIALNSLGESSPAKPRGTISTDNDELPPVIWDVSGKNDAFHVGFSSHYRDFKYEIEYGLAPENYARSHIIETHGATRIPAIEEGIPHYFRMRRLVTGSVDSEWTPEYRVDLPTLGGMPAPQNTYVQQSGDDALLIIQPVDRATGYVISVGSGNDVRVITVKQAQSKFVVLDNLKLAGTQTVTISTLDEHGNAGRSAPVRLVE